MLSLPARCNAWTVGTPYVLASWHDPKRTCIMTKIIILTTDCQWVHSVCTRLFMRLEHGSEEVCLPFAIQMHSICTHKRRRKRGKKERICRQELQSTRTWRNFKPNVINYRPVEVVCLGRIFRFKERSPCWCRLCRDKCYQNENPKNAVLNHPCSAHDQWWSLKACHL